MAASNHPPPDGSAYAHLPKPLRETIIRSFLDRVSGTPGAQDNLMFGFRDPAPKTPWEALDNLGLMAVNLLVQLYDRIDGIDETGETWKQIRWIRNQWWGGSAGIKVAYWNPAAMRFRLDGLSSGRHGNRVARDTYIGALDHQMKPAHLLLHGMLDPRAEPPDADTWREVDMPMKVAVHFCVGKGDLRGPEDDRPVKLDDIHLDWSSPVGNMDPDTGYCNYLEPWQGALEHWYQAHYGHDAPVFTFDCIEKDIAHGREVFSRQREEAELTRLREFATQWSRIKHSLAVRGKSGYDESLGHYETLKRLLGPFARNAR
ncbi:MAG: hypothetical protein IPM54_33020 [Polyangiaceae bacterium]|nr:hypothetical protein [Polyangiaceae bacterium]